MTEARDERDQLIADLLEEAHGLRMKLEDFSQYTESKVAEYVVARKSLTEERDAAQHHYALARNDLEVFRQRQSQMQDDLVRLTKERDDVRRRLEALKASWVVRLVARVRRVSLRD